MSTTITHKIDEYKVLLCSRDADWVGSYRYMASITLYSSGQAVASLKFLPGVGNNNDSFYVNGSGLQFLNMNFEDKDFDRVLALLQNETPLYVHLRKTYKGSGGIGSISSDKEPVGEEES
jgi:hypothetical protein